MPQSVVDNPGPARARHGLTPKGRRTRAALLGAARGIFEQEGYYQASVAEIGRRCAVSQGTFYQYFNNKDQVFREILDEVLAGFWRRAHGLEHTEEAADGGLEPVLRLILEHCRDNAALHRVLNEYELIESATIGYFDSIARFLRQFVRRAVNQGLARPLDPNLIAYSLIGMATFQNMDWERSCQPPDLDRLARLTADLLWHGISGSRAWKPPRDLAASALSPSDEGGLQWEPEDGPGSRTRRSIFQAAEQVFGEFGYSRAQISEITRRAGVAQGTFYVHFKSKQELMNGVVRFLSHELRRELRRVTDQTADRREQEREGMIAFFAFLRRHSRIYRIVAESEAIVPESADYYYQKLARGYQRSLEPAMDRNEIRRLPVEFLTRSLMGLNHMIGLRWLVWNSSSSLGLPGQVLNDAVDLTIFGLGRHD